MTTNTTQKARLHHRPRLMRRWYPRPAQCSASVTRAMNLATTAWRAERAGQRILNLSPSSPLAACIVGHRRRGHARACSGHRERSTAPSGSGDQPAPWRDLMCFSPEADLTTGVIVGAVGIDALRHTSRPQQMVLASLPLLLAVHEIDEALVWWGLRGQLPWAVTHAAIYIFLTVAFALPFLVPLATLGIEPVVQ